MKNKCQQLLQRCRCLVYQSLIVLGQKLNFNSSHDVCIILNFLACEFLVVVYVCPYTQGGISSTAWLWRGTSMPIGQFVSCVQVVANSDGSMLLSYILAPLRQFSLQNGLFVFGLGLVRPSGNLYKGPRNNSHTQGLVWLAIYMLAPWHVQGNDGGFFSRTLRFCLPCF